MEKAPFAGYEYQKVAVKRSLVSVYAGGYQNFGWELEDTREPPGNCRRMIHQKYAELHTVCQKAYGLLTV